MTSVWWQPPNGVVYPSRDAVDPIRCDRCGRVLDTTEGPVRVGADGGNHVECPKVAKWKVWREPDAFTPSLDWCVARKDGNEFALSPGARRVSYVALPTWRHAMLCVRMLHDIEATR